MEWDWDTLTVSRSLRFKRHPVATMGAGSGAVEIKIGARDATIGSKLSQKCKWQLDKLLRKYSGNIFAIQMISTI